MGNLTEKEKSGHRALDGSQSVRSTAQKYCPKCAAIIFERQCSCGWSAGKAIGKAIATTAALVIAGCAFYFTYNNFRLWFPDKAGASEHITKGNDYLDQEKYDLAIEEFRQATSLNPSDAQTHRLLSKALDLGDQVHQALDEITIAVKLAPNDYDINYKYVALLEDQDKYAEALAPEIKLLALHPHDAALKRAASFLYEQLGDKNKALELMRQAVEENQQSEKGWYNYASLLDDMGRTSEGMKVLQQGLKVIPDGSSLYYEMGRFLASTNHPADAIEPLKKAVSLDPDDDDASELLEQITKAAGKPVYIVQLKKYGLSFVADVIINEKVRTKLVLDSGATNVVISNDVVKRLGVNLNSTQEIPFESATGHAVGHEVILKSVRLGDATISDIKAIAYDTPSQDGEEGLLGMTFLSHFKFTLDAQHSQLWLSTR